MPTTVVLCTDGSELAHSALAAGLALLGPADRTVVVTVVQHADESLVSGASGMAGGTMSPEAFEELDRALVSGGEKVVAEAAAELGVGETKVLHGHPGDAVCTFAEEIGASVVVMGSRGRGGIKRAVLGSVSDYVTRHASCPVLISREGGS